MSNSCPGHPLHRPARRRAVIEKRNPKTDRERTCPSHGSLRFVASETIRLSGYDWVVKSGTHEGPGPNNWNENSVWVDEDRYLHLKLTQRGDRWYCAEVLTKDRLGFGRY